MSTDNHKYKSPVTISNFLLESELLFDDIFSFSLFRDYKEDTKIPICITSESSAIRMTSTNQTKKKKKVFCLIWEKELLLLSTPQHAP